MTSMLTAPPGYSGGGGSSSPATTEEILQGTGAVVLALAVLIGLGYAVDFGFAYAVAYLKGVDWTARNILWMTGDVFLFWIISRWIVRVVNERYYTDTWFLLFLTSVGTGICWLARHGIESFFS